MPDGAELGDSTVSGGTPSRGVDGIAARRPTRSVRRTQVLKRSEGRTRRMVAAVPVIVFLGVLVAFTAFARTMRAQEQAQLRLAAGLSAEDVAHRLGQLVRFRLELLERVRDDLATGHIADEQAFREHASEMRHYFPGVAALNWVDDQGVIRWLVPAEGNEAARGRDLDEHPVAAPALHAARDAGALRITGPLDLYQGGRGFAAYAPVGHGDAVLGYVNAAFRYAPLLQECLEGEEARAHYVRISDAGETLQAWEDGNDLEGIDLTTARRVRIANREWTVTLRPTRAQVAVAQTWADEIALGLGVVVAFSLSLLAYRLAHDRALVRTSRERYRNVVDDTPALICRFLPGGRITFVNVAFARTAGAPPRELIGTSFYDRLPETTRDETRRAHQQLDAETPSRFHELELRGTDGSRTWQQWIDRALLDAGGDVVEYQSVGLDVTRVRQAQEEVQRSEERFRTIFNSVSDGILLFDQHGGLKDINARACVLFGMGREELMARGIDALGSPRARELREWLEQAATKGRLAIADWKAKAADGRRWRAELELSRTTIAGTARIVVVVRDITARIELAEQLRHSQRMEAMGTLAGGIAHDFNNILTAIMGHAELARMTVGTESTERRSLDGITAACEQAIGVTRSLLTFSRREATPRTAVDLATVVRDTLELLRPLISGSIEITSDLVSCDPLWVDADTSQVQQVLMNLALNARDAMPRGGRIHVRLYCEAHYDSARSTRDWSEDVVIEVRDDGVGMDEDVRRRVAEPFFTTKTRERGTGLGMAVVHGIVTSHGGSIEIDSERGVGTTVRVLLPRRDAPPEVDTDTQPSVDLSTVIGGRALVVEDNEQVRDLLAAVLTQCGFRVDEAGDGAAAWSLYDSGRGPWDMIVLDIDLPGMTGTECLRRIRETGDDVPVLLVSGNPEFAEDAVDPPRTRFLRKPFTMRELARVAGEMTTAQPTRPV